jgi:hypothetical protein
MATPTNLPASFVAGAVLTAAQQNDLRGAFRILQVVQGTSTSLGTSTSATFIDSNITATITPQSSTSKILVLVSQNAFATTAGTGIGMRIVRGSTTIWAAADICYGTASGNIDTWSPIYMDSPATTSATTYKTTFARTTGTGIAYTQPNGSNSSIILCEVSA